MWRIYLASGMAAALVYPMTFLPLHPIIVAVSGGVVYLLLLIPLMAFTGAVEGREMKALDVYFRSVGPVSPLFGIMLRYYEVFDKDLN